MRSRGGSAGCGCGELACSIVCVLMFVWCTFLVFVFFLAARQVRVRFRALIFIVMHKYPLELAAMSRGNQGGVTRVTGADNRRDAASRRLAASTVIWIR